jgi:3' terminal RNA ribose 2'-O-methyltransferase Hen1
MSGRCEKRQSLADAPLNLEAALVMLPCRGSTDNVRRVFTPLGYEVEFDSHLLDEKFPGWGPSRYINLRLRGKVRLRDLLRHLYVLIPVFDRQKHYWFGQDEVDKLLAHGKGWLEDHPEKIFITSRYLKNLRGFTRRALDRLDNGEAGAEEFSPEEAPVEQDGDAPRRENLNTRRLAAVLEALVQSGAHSVIDLGCGEGNLLRLLVKEKQFTRIAGVDVSPSVLARAGERLKADTLGERLRLFQGSLTYRDARLRGYDAAAVVEVMEHLEENRLDAFAAVLFGDAAPRTIILTTPNSEYNENYAALTGGRGLRHGDHRFEWTRERLRAWAEAAAAEYGYRVRYEDIGDRDEARGAPTQMGVFTKCG